MVDTLADTLRVAEAGTYCDALGYVKTDAVADLLADTLAEAETKVLGVKQSGKVFQLVF